MEPCRSAQVCTISPEKKGMNLHLNFIKDCNNQLQVQIYKVLPTACLTAELKIIKLKVGAHNESTRVSLVWKQDKLLTPGTDG